MKSSVAVPQDETLEPLCKLGRGGGGINKEDRMAALGRTLMESKNSIH